MTGGGNSSWSEYERLIRAGVNRRAAMVLALGAGRPEDERAYWRSIARGRRPTPGQCAAHAHAQQARRSAARRKAA
jgi:hypothetical protein